MKGQSAVQLLLVYASGQAQTISPAGRGGSTSESFSDTMEEGLLIAREKATPLLDMVRGVKLPKEL